VIQVRRRPGKAKVRRIIAAENFAVPARSCTDVHIKVVWNGLHNMVPNWLAEPREVRPGMVTARSLIDGKSTSGRIRVLNCDDVTRRLTAGELIGEAEPVINVVNVGSDRASEIGPLRPGACRDAIINSDRAPMAGHPESDDNRAPKDEKDRVSETASPSNFRREFFSNSDIDALDLIAEYNMRIEHRAGTAHRNADALSRRPCIGDEGEECLQCARWRATTRVRRVKTRAQTAAKLRAQGRAPAGPTPVPTLVGNEENEDSSDRISTRHSSIVN
jgi:hypothetical protein